MVFTHSIIVHGGLGNQLFQIFFFNLVLFGNINVNMYFPVRCSNGISVVLIGIIF